MRSWGLCAVLLVAACYEAPSSHAPCAITCTDSCPGNLTCSSGFCVEPGQVCDPTFTQVSAGNGFACGIDDLGALWCWGSNAHHEIDPGDRLQYPLATRVDSGPWTSVDAGGGHVCGIDGDGHLFCWGKNDHSQVGPVSGDVATRFPIVVPDGPARWTAVDAGWESTCAIGDGKPYCWGRDAHGSLGLGGLTQFMDIADPSPVMTALTDWTSISIGPNHGCGISTSSGVLCWGFADFGAVGPAGSGDITTPIVALAGSARAVAVSEYATCAATSAGALMCWGDNTNGELGELNMAIPNSTKTPMMATTTMGWTQLGGNTSAFCGLAGDALYCWGGEVNGGLANGIWAETRRWAKVMTGASGATVGWNYDYDPITQANSHYLELGCALVGTDVRCWGDNRFGQLGTGHATMAIEPTEVDGDHRFTKLALGDDHGCGVEGNNLYCWGSTVYGAVAAVSTGGSSPRTPCMTGLDCDLGTPKQIGFVSGVDDVATGASHTCALANDVITCWGNNAATELGTAAPGPFKRMVAQPGGRPWVSLLPTGREGQCATPGGGETWCWGSVITQHAPSHETVLDNIKQLVVGDHTLCVRDSTDTLACGGQATLGQFGTAATGGCGDLVCNADESSATCAVDCGPGPLTNLGRKYTSIAFSAYGEFGCGVRPDQHVECWGGNPRGQTGATKPGTTMVQDPTFLPNVIASLGGCTAVTAASATACALCNGAISCWGDGGLGQLGAGPLATEPATTPRRIDLQLEGDPWIQLASGNGFSCARSMSGRVFCWGIDGHAGLGTGGAAANLPVTVVATPAH